MNKNKSSKRVYINGNDFKKLMATYMYYVNEVGIYYIHLHCKLFIFHCLLKLYIYTNSSIEETGQLSKMKLYTQYKYTVVLY